MSELKTRCWKERAADQVGRNKLGGVFVDYSDIVLLVHL